MLYNSSNEYRGFVFHYQIGGIPLSDNTTNTQFHHSLFLQRENHQTHLPYEEELRFYEAVKDGNIARLKEIMLPLDSYKLGVLSNNPVRNFQYHLTITIAFITRFCIEGGMNVESAYTLSDINIRKLDACTSTKEIVRLHHDIVFDYALRMQKIHTEKDTSLPVIRCIDYIHQNLHEAISLQNLAEYTERNPTYLCGLFKKEMKITIAQYIRECRIEAAENMLKFSDYPYLDICNYLAFSSYSHFINVFKKKTGLTPKEYRKKYYRSKWR